jgi:hypothetical protein
MTNLVNAFVGQTPEMPTDGVTLCIWSQPDTIDIFATGPATT